MPYAPLHFISARHGTGVGELVGPRCAAYESAMREMPTRMLNRALEQALEAHQPPLVHGRRIKLRYAHQGGRNPPRIIVHGNQASVVPDAYARYLANVFRKTFDLYATPVVVGDFAATSNPYRAPGKRPHRGAERWRSPAAGARNSAGIHESWLQHHREMQVRTGHAAGHADLADACPPWTRMQRPACDSDRDSGGSTGSAALGRDQDDHGVAVEEVVAGIDDRAVRGGPYRCAVGAAMSMPVCGLRASPLNTRRKPKELERTPGTGCSSRRVPGRVG